MNPLVPLPVLIPLSAAILLGLLNKHCGRWFADLTAILATAVAGSVAAILIRQSAAAPIVYWYGGWTPRAGVAVGVDFYVDPFGAGLATFVCVLALASLVFSLHYFDSVGTLYHVLVLGFVAAMCGFCLSGDLFNLFVFFELMSVAAFTLCGYKTEEPGTQQGAINFAVLNTIGGFLALLGLGMFYARTGALNLVQIGHTIGQDASLLVVTAFVFVVCGFLVKGAAFPFHFWLADAHAVAPTPVCVLFSGVMVELGVYAVARIYWVITAGAFASRQSAVTGVFLTIGVLTALTGAVMCFAQRHIKRLLAYSTISHAGLLIIGFGLLKPDALAGAALYLIGHGAAKGALFLVAGILLHRFGSVDEPQLYGRGRGMKWSGIIFLLGGVALAGAIPFGTFVGEHAIDAAAEHSRASWLKFVFFFAAVFTSGAVFRVYARIFQGWGVRGVVLRGAKPIKERRETRGPHDHAPSVMFMPALILILISFVLGLLPRAVQMARSMAFVFADHAAYNTRVLNGRFFPIQNVPPEHLPLLSALLRCFAALGCGMLLARFAISRAWHSHPLYLRRIQSSIGWMRRLHSGKVGDYVAYFTFGVAGIGLALAALITW